MQIIIVKAFNSDDRQTLLGLATMNPYHQGINYAEVKNSDENRVAMASSARWQGKDENDWLDFFTCVFNIIPAECSKCTTKKLSVKKRMDMLILINSS